MLKRLSDRLGIEQADLYINARGDKEAALIITLERIADAVDAHHATTKASGEALGAKVAELEAENEALKAKLPPDVVGPVMVETVNEKPMVTTEVIEVKNDAGLTIDNAKPKGKGKGDSHAS